MYLFYFLILPICFFLSGIICMIVSNKKANNFIGYRTKNSLSNQEVWKFSNHKFGILALRLSIVMFLGNIMFYGLGLYNDCLRGLTFLVIFIDLMIYILPIFIIEDEIKKNFKDLEPEEYSKFSKILILITVLLLFIFLFFGKNEVDYNNNIITIDAFMYSDLKVDLKDVKNIEIRDDFDYGRKIVGLNNLVFNQGKFKNDEIDNYKLYVYVDNKTSILLHLKDDSLVVFNKEFKEETKEIYDILIKDFENIEK